MPELPLIGVTAVIAGMAIFNRDAAQVESRLLSIGRVTGQLESETVGAFGGTATAFGTMAASIATGATFISGALLLAGGISIKFAADFQQQMSLIEAATSDGSEQSKTAISQLDSYITELSRTGVISLHDLAEGALELARSGVDIPGIMGGALKGVQLLTEASGGEISLKSAADLVANAMHAFNISATDTERITTAAAVVAQNSTATYTGFGTAVAIAGASFQAAGFSIEDLAISETILTRNGLNASTAATALRGVIQRLELPSKAAADVMQQYGIHLFDAAGKGVGLRAVIGQLSDAFGQNAIDSGKVTEAQRATALATLGLQRTSVAMFDLATSGTKVFDELALSFGRLKASDLADIVIKPLNAQFDIAVNNVQALAKAFGFGFLPPLQATSAQLIVFLQNLRLSDMKNFGAQVADASKAIIGGIGGAIATLNGILSSLGLTATAGDVLKTTLVGLGVVVLAVLVPPILATVAALAQFLAIIALVGTAVKVISGFVATAANAFANWVAQFGAIGNDVSNVFKVISDGANAVSLLLSGNFTGAANAAQLAFHEFTDTIQIIGGKVLDGLGQSLDDTGAAWAPWAADAGQAGGVVMGAVTAVHQVVEGLAFLLQGNFAAASKDFSAAAGTAAEAFGKLAELLQSTVLGALGGIRDGLNDVATKWLPGILASGDFGAAVYDAVHVALDVIYALIHLLQGDFNAAFVSAGRAGTGFSAMLSDLSNAIAPIVSALTGAFQTALDWFATTGFPALQDAASNAAGFFVNTLVPNLLTLAGVLSGAVQTGLQWLIDTGWPAIQAGAATIGDVFSTLGAIATATVAKVAAQAPYDALVYIWGQLVEAGGHLGDVILDLGRLLLTIVSPLINIGTVADDTGGSIDVVATASNALANFVHGLVAELAIEATIFNVVLSAIDAQIRIITELIGTVIRVTAVTAGMLGAQDDLAQIWANLQTIGSALVKAYEDVTGSLNAMGDATGTSVNAFDVLRAIAQVVGTIIGTILALAIKLVTATILDLTQWIINAIRIVGDFITIIQAVAGALHDFGSIVGTVAGLIIEFAGAVVNAFLHDWPVIGELFNQLGTTISDALDEWLNSLNPWIDAIDGKIAEMAAGFQAGFSSVVATVGDAANAIGSIFSAVGETIGTVFSAIGTAAQAFVSELGRVLTESPGEFLANAASQWQAWQANILGVLTAIVAAVTTWASDVLAVLTGLITSAGAAAASIAGSIIDGLAGGLRARAQEVGTAAASIASNALDMARNAVHAQSPSRDFEVLGEDMGEGLNLGLLGKIPKVQDTAKTYGDTILAELATFTGNVETASRDIGNKLTDIATKAGEAQVKAINSMNHDIAAAIDSTQEQLNRLGGALADPTSNAAQEQAIQARIKAEKDAHAEQRKDDDEIYQHKKDLADADATYQKNVNQENAKSSQAIAKEQTKFESDLAAASTASQKAQLEQRHTDAVAAQTQAHKDALANLATRLVDDKATADQRFNDSKAETIRQRGLDQGERDFQKQEDAKITAFNEAQLLQERDTKISTITQAEQTNVATTQTSADQQRALLLRSYTARIEDLRDQLLDKIPPLTGEAADTLQAFMDNVEAETAATTQSITDAMGQTIITSVGDVGSSVHQTLGSGGTVPTAAAVSTGAFNTTTTAVGGLGTDMGNVARDQATQIAAVLLRLRDGLTGQGDYAGHGLIAAVNDLAAAIAALKDKTITITTIYNDQHNGSSSSSSGGGGSGGGSAGDGSSGPGGSRNDPTTGQPYTNSPTTNTGGGGQVINSSAPGAGRTNPYQFAEGGVVPGAWGAPMLAIVHGGEFVASLNSEAAKWARQAAMYQPIVSREYNYNVNASYANTQSPASVSMDMRALVALSRGS